MQRVPMLIGIAGHVKGEKIALDYGAKMVVGRSRDVNISLRRMAVWRGMSEEEREKDESMRTVSGKHFEVTMYNTKSIEVVNLSPNGTRLDDEPVEREIIDDVATSAHVIRFGRDEVFSLELAELE